MSLQIKKDEWTAFGKALIKELKIMEGKPYVKVGLPAGVVFEKLKEERVHDSIVIDESLTVGMVAIFNEFGLGVPERSFIRSTFDEKQREIKDFIIQKQFEVTGLKITTEQALNQIGAFGAKLMVEKIDSFVPPPNAESTIFKKDSSMPLIDTGQLRQTIMAQGWLAVMPK